MLGWCSVRLSGNQHVCGICAVVYREERERLHWVVISVSMILEMVLYDKRSPVGSCHADGHTPPNTAKVSGYERTSRLAAVTEVGWAVYTDKKLFQDA